MPINPKQLIGLIKNGNPKQVALQIIQSNFSNDPLAQNLLTMGQRGDIKGLEEFATQYFNQQGRDFNLEMNNFMNMIYINTNLNQILSLLLEYNILDRLFLQKHSRQKSSHIYLKRIQFLASDLLIHLLFQFLL